MVEAALRHVPGGASTADRPGMVTSKLGLPTGLAGLWLAIPTHDGHRLGGMMEHGSVDVGVSWPGMHISVFAREEAERNLRAARARISDIGVSAPITLPD